MTQTVDFKKYQYYFNGWIARKNKKTNKTEMFKDGQWIECKFKRDIDLMAHVGDEDVMEIGSPNKQFLQEQLNGKGSK
ncbi:MAG: hypothetical protein FWF97_04055 [Alphaproteobacteria bacterium]|nr:hypothetical protein [Alphaproteobacteria bacterium]